MSYSGKLLKSNAEEVARIIRGERGETFKADWHGATDAFDSEGVADVVHVNDGRGFEQGVRVINRRDGTMFYLGPFEIETMPNSARMFIFHCTGAFLVRPPELGPPPRG